MKALLNEERLVEIEERCKKFKEEYNYYYTLLNIDVLEIIDNLRRWRECCWKQTELFEKLENSIRE